MAKSPAVLFYTADFLIGVDDLSNEQVGMYIRLLCKQHQTGHLTRAQMERICGKFDAEVFAKFKIDDEGNFYNERMKIEIENRSKYCESRGNNKRGKNHMKIISKSYEDHMENENDNENDNIILKDKGGVGEKGKPATPAKIFKPPTLDEVKDFVNSQDGSILQAENFHDYYTSNGWMVGKNKMKDWNSACRKWIRTSKEQTTEKQNGRTNKTPLQRLGRKLTDIEQGKLEQRKICRSYGKDPDREVGPLSPELKDAGFE
jgi:hypothetical protein